MTADLAAWLLEQIAEDEAVARAATGGEWRPGALVQDGRRLWSVSAAPRPQVARVEAEADAAHIARWDPARVLAECEAKRRIVERYLKIQGSQQDGDLVERQTLRWVMELHAVAYADREGYDEALRP